MGVFCYTESGLSCEVALMRIVSNHAMGYAILVSAKQR